MDARAFDDRVTVTYRFTHAKCGNEPEIREYLFLRLPRSDKNLHLYRVARSEDMRRPGRTAEASVPAPPKGNVCGGSD